MKLKNFVMVMFANDTMVVPKESEVRKTLHHSWCVFVLDYSQEGQPNSGFPKKELTTHFMLGQHNCVMNCYCCNKENFDCSK